MPKTRIRIVRVPLWGFALIGALLVAIVIASAVLAAGLFLILFPIMLVVGAIVALFGWPRMRTGGAYLDTRGVIETDYVVLDEQDGGKEKLTGKSAADRDHSDSPGRVGDCGVKRFYLNRWKTAKVGTIRFYRNRVESP